MVIFRRCISNMEQTTTNPFLLEHRMSVCYIIAIAFIMAILSDVDYISFDLKIGWVVFFVWLILHPYCVL